MSKRGGLTGQMERKMSPGRPPLAAAAQLARGVLRDLGSVAIAFSGGVDSTLVLKLALDELGPDRVVAVTAHGPLNAEDDLDLARRLTTALGVRHVVVPFDQLALPGFADNPPDRCFICRKAMLGVVAAVAQEHGLAAVVDGANADDAGEYRPGSRAAELMGVKHPLAEGGAGKDAIRALARELDLPNWERPAAPCLVTRFPYGERVTVDKLATVAASESFLLDLGFSPVRVRHHGMAARIEVPRSQIPALADAGVLPRVVRALRGLGYAYVTLDLEGFRSGSMDETLDLHRDDPHRETRGRELDDGR